jgi:hypothetical protein
MPVGELTLPGYRFAARLSATVHMVLGKRAKLTYTGWIKVTRRPAE